MQQTTSIFWVIPFLLLHTQAWGQVRWQVGGNMSLAYSLPEQVTPDITGVSSRNFIHPQYQITVNMSMNNLLGLETGIGMQYHGTSLRYVPDFGIHKGKKRFLRDKGMVNMFAIPLLATYKTKLAGSVRLRFVAGAVWLINPWLDSYIIIDGRANIGTDSLLYTRSEAWVLPFSSINFMSRAEFVLPVRRKVEATIGLLYQHGSNRTLRQTRFSYSLSLPVYDQRITWENRGSMIGLSMGIMYGGH